MIFAQNMTYSSKNLQELAVGNTTPVSMLSGQLALAALVATDKLNSTISKSLEKDVSVQL